jgi:putative transposase
MALNTLTSDPGSFSLLHHSDRGLQYCSKEYVRILKSKHIAISMTEDGNPLDNSIAERINGIIKQEYLSHYTIRNKIEAMKILSKSVAIYNQKRPHMNCDLNTPEKVHQLNLPIKKRWKNYYKNKV